MVVYRYETTWRLLYHEDNVFKNEVITLRGKKHIRNLIPPYHPVRIQQEASISDLGNTVRIWVFVLQK